MRNKFNRFFIDNPRYGLEDYSYAQKEIGSKNILGRNELIQVLGWDIKGQFWGYAKGGLRRIGRHVQYFRG